MKKALLTSAIVAGLSISSFTANANDKHTISLGYAQSDLRMKTTVRDDLNLKDLKDPRGLNLKYRYEINDNWGVIGSVTQTKLKIIYHNDLANNIGNEDITYRSLVAGPTYRFNEYVSTYALIGAANVKDHQTVQLDTSKKKTALAYGAGLQFNPISSVAVDVSYEYSDFNQAKAGTWTVGVGYHF
ncbi:outer membrane beta-barrel protein [Xenorhabdus sp. DI]|uniref:Ail/Lom family outer membrane beta-barrel protein n=1 Tax=Xenorhabdus doucetiae TaxID=351671 RepID=UPI0019CEDE7E|nr:MULTISPECIES: Ail/Lom family outer membrane beta-barrel protein [unclassified Xenorhabdus]MBD2783337.1 outer membrane beta-barrel protein [Xenorhabdus sp. 3]MBD2787978.1 outer membrane beta-barrel protein [Xenorhabdus sp. DI]MBD2796000.1 outer membrane beta-barrel protein [Xenorhabdus sp. 18]